MKASSPLVTSRFVYFLFYAAWAALLPFLPLYYKSKGFSGSQIGILTGILPLVTLFGAPFWGGVADLTQQRRGVLVGVMVGVMASVALLMRMDLFWLLMLCVLAYAFFQSPIIPLIDTSVLSILRERRGDYGKVRVWGAIGWGVSAPLAGWLTTRLGATFRFDLYLGLMGLCALAASRFPVAALGNGANYWKGVGRLLADRRWFVFLLAVFLAGMSASLVNNFLFLYMNELKSTETVMGLALTMATLSEAPALFFSGKLVRKLGSRGVLLMALGVYALRLFAYSLSTQPWQILLIQLTHGLTFAAVWAAGVSYAGELAPPGLEATAQGLFNATLMGFGGIAGALIGGLLLERFGGAGMYSFGAAAAAGGMLVFFLASRSTRLPVGESRPAG